MRGKITDEIFDSLMEIRREAKHNMFDINAIQREAYQKEFFDLVIFLEEHPKDYVNFILTGERGE